jgi:hypothetical protein
LCGYESYYRTIGAVVYGRICCVGMNHITELLVHWSMGGFRNTFSIIFIGQMCNICAYKLIVCIMTTIMRV